MSFLDQEIGVIREPDIKGGLGINRHEWLRHQETGLV